MTLLQFGNSKTGCQVTPLSLPTQGLCPGLMYAAPDGAPKEARMRETFLTNS
jgi:hypothetical protein